MVLRSCTCLRKTGSFVFTSATETGVFAIVLWNQQSSTCEWLDWCAWLWQLQAVSCKAVYDLFTKLIDPTTNTGHVVAAPIQKYVRGALLAYSVLHSHA